MDPILVGRRAALGRLLPRNFVVSTCGATRDRFLHSWGHAYFLLFPLGPELQELAAGLAVSGAPDAGGRPLRPTFEVTMRTQRLLSASEVERLERPRSIPPSPRVDIHLLLERLEASAHFVVPLQNRPGAGEDDGGRVSVGRGGTNDIVLKHPSVSKVHGWFEMDEFGTVYVGDLGSKNGTKVNGEIRRARELTALVPGDTVCFGSIEALLCPPDALWDLIQT